MSFFRSAKTQKVKPATRLSGSVRLPGDKSISHRYAMLAAIAEGESRIHFFSSSADCQSTLECLRKLGVRISRKDGLVSVQGAGLRGLRAAASKLDAGNSGSTMRMLSGILAGQPFRSVIGGDSSLSRRPMKRIIDPLSQMGARFESNEGGLPPLIIEGGPLQAIRYQLPIPSAQVKTAVLLAGLYAGGDTEIAETIPTRDHTEIALEHMGAPVARHGQTILVQGMLANDCQLQAKELAVPGDISAAAFFIIACLLVPESNLAFENLGLNPTRTAILDLLLSMGARIKIANVDLTHGELIGDLQVETSELKGGEIPSEAIPGLIDELPALAVLGTQTELGLSFRGAAELRVKESDRIRAVAENLRRMGAEVKELPDGLRVPGKQKLRGAEVNSYGDHRIAMAFAIAGLLGAGTTLIRDSECVEISFPDFFDVLSRVTKT
jgi:3-phosphoshikimate 1-carboxyvinyltransferase